MTDDLSLLRTDGLVWDRFRHHAESTPEREAIVHWKAGEEPVRWAWGRLVATASQLVPRLVEAGVRPGHVCAILVRHHPAFYPVYLAISALGALPSVLAYPNPRLHPDKFRQGLEGMSQRSGLDYIVTERALEATVQPLVTKPGSTIRGLLFPIEWCEALAPEAAVPFVEHAPVPATSPVLLQHSSGTTGLQKPVVLSHRAVLEHVERYARSLALAPHDKIVSWLPLYHDMGLIAAYYLPLVFNVPLVQLDPFEWVTAPALLWQALSHERATLCWLPNFAYNFMAERIRDDELEGIRLDSLRMVINCSEPVRAESHDKLFARFAPYGLRREALAACYAMAETTYAVTQTPPGREARVLPVLRDELARGDVVVAPRSDRTRLCVSSGPVIDGCRVRVVDEARTDLPAGKVGEIAIASVSLFDGYRNYPEKTAEVLDGAWYFSGDLGFVHESECYVIGRKKDVVILAGNNVYPEDVEDVVGRVPGVLAGRVIAFGAEDEKAGTEILCVVAETEAGTDEARRAVRTAILRAGMAIDVTIARVYLVEPRWLIKSSSGKPARSTNKARALAERSHKS